MNELIQEKTRLLNELIQEYAGRSLKSAELRKLLISRISSNVAIIVHLMKSFPSVKIGRERLYEMPEKPIYIGVMETAYKKHNAAVKRLRNKKKNAVESPVLSVIPEPQALSTEQTIALLKAEGYKVMKPLRFNEEAFKKDYPELYENYLVYESV